MSIDAPVMTTPTNGTPPARRARSGRNSPAEITVPFTVVVDTREQERGESAYTFSNIFADVRQRSRRLIVPTIRRKINAGDYSIDGHDGYQGLVRGGEGLSKMMWSPAGVSIERKSLADLYGTLGQSRARFTRELDRLAGYEFAAVIVEASWYTVLKAPELGLVRSQLNPKTIYRSVIAWQQRYPTIHWWMCEGRAHAEVTVFRILERWWLEREWANTNGAT